MRATLAGTGATGADLTPQAACALADADVVLGAERLLRALPPTNARIIVATRADDVARALRNAPYAQRAFVALSGDTGFFSGARRLLELLEAEGHDVEVLPGISSVQLLSARLRKPWTDWVLASAHGRNCDVVGLVREGRPVFLLTSDAKTVHALCSDLNEAGLGDATVTLAERLGYADERVRTAFARDLIDATCDSLNVLLIEIPPQKMPLRRTPGIPDDAFIRGDVPMTKQEVRAAILCKLAVTPNDVCWDVGAGTGAVSVELALASRETWAIECRSEALELIRQNRNRFCAWNLRVVAGKAPEVLPQLPKPDVVLVGGSSGNLEDILSEAHAANPEARICVSAIALETLEGSLAWMDAHDMQPEVTQIAISRTRRVGGRHLLMANNPVFLVVGDGGALPNACGGASHGNGKSLGRTMGGAE